MADQYMSLVEDANSKYELPDGLLPAMYQAETGGQKNRATAVSPAGAVGPMQIKQAAAEDLGINRFDPAENIDGGARYVKKHLDEYGGDVNLALMAYNWGPGHTKAWIAGDPENGIQPKDPERIPQETRDYISKIERTRAGMPGATATKPDPLVANATLPKDVVDRFVTYQGVRIPVQAAADVPQEELDARFASSPLNTPANVSKHAVKQGLRYNWTTNTVEKYGNVDKFLIGAGRTVDDFVGGAQQLVNMATGNAKALKESQLQTDAERQLYGYLDDAGVGMEDVGQVLAYAPLLFGGAGIVGIAGRAGLRSATEAGASRLVANAAKGAAGTAAASGEAGVTAASQRTGEGESNLQRGAGAAAATAVLGAGGTSLWAVGSKIGPAAMARWGAGALVDAYYTGGAATILNVAGALYRVHRSTKGAESKFAAESMDWVAKLGKDKVNAKLVEMTAVAPDAASKQAAGAALEARIADHAAEQSAKYAAEMADTARKIPKATKGFEGARPASTAPVPKVPEVTAPKPNYGGRDTSQVPVPKIPATGPRAQQTALDEMVPSVKSTPTMRSRSRPQIDLGKLGKRDMPL